MRNLYPRLSRIEAELEEELEKELVGAPMAEVRRRAPEILQQLAKLLGLPVPEAPDKAALDLVIGVLKKRTKGCAQEGLRFLREAVQNSRR